MGDNTDPLTSLQCKSVEPAITLFGLKKLIASLMLPPTGPLLLVAAGLLLTLRWRRAGLVTAWSGVLLALLLASPLFVNALIAPLERDTPVTVDQTRQTQAIVVLGGGKRSYAPEYEGETLNRFTLERLRYGARLARQTALPLLVTGGRLYGDTSEAELMRKALEDEFGVTVRWTEDGARDTRGNARLSAELLHADAVDHVLLVTHAAHMPRAQAEFEAHGLQVTPAPTAWFSRPDAFEQPLTLLPDAAAAHAGWFAVHEWLGGLAYRLTRTPVEETSQD